MRLLFIGDIVGRPGKHACSQIVPRLIRERNLACVIANAENTAAGSGLTPPMFTKLRHYGIDVCTMGDHIYKRREIYSVLEQSDHIVRPANLQNEAVGRPYTIVQARDGTLVGVVSLLGQTYMNVRGDCPFHAIDRVLALLPKEVRVILVDMHAETTSEKVAMGWYLDGRVSVVVGTHTHVPTADERVLPNGTAYITDVGMTGPHDSVLGRDKQRVIASLVTGMPHPYDVAHGDIRLSAVLVELDADSGRARCIERLSLREESPVPPMDDS